MAKQNSRTPVAVNFKDVDKEAVARAQATLAGGKQDPLTPPAGAKSSTDKNGVEYTRWTERATVVSASRGTSKSGLLEVLVVVKIRQSSKENTGRKVFSRYYKNLGTDIPAGHEIMNDLTTGAFISLLTATGFMPAGGALKGSLLDRMFPLANQPGTASPLVGKSVIVNIVQELKPQKDRKTGKMVVDEDGDPILERRDKVESYLPETEVVEEEEE